MLTVDLHSHSTISDGLLAPADLVARAAGQGVHMLALTDHDHLGGLDEARGAAAEKGIALIPGVEVSVTWNNHTLHVVGLGIDDRSEALRAGLESLRRGRRERALRIAESLARAGIQGSLEGALRFALNPELVARTHFARFLVERRHARDLKRVFKRFLTRGKPGYAAHQWATLEEAVGWIRNAGGSAILAHPGRYDFGETSMRALLGEFRDLGGSGIEVVSGSHTPEQFVKFAGHARTFGLRASAGSDFHGPGESHFDVGRLPDLPGGCDPVWSDWWPEGVR